MAAIRSVGHRSVSSDTQSTQSLLQHSYFIAAVVMVVALVILRIIVLRWRNRKISDFFRIGGRSEYPYVSQPPNDPSHGSMYPGIQLAPLPAVYRPDRRIRAADTDAHGRRLGPAGEDLDGKDALPAYDSVDRPPKYMEAGWSHGHPMEQFTVAPSHQEEQRGMTHLTTTNGTPVDNVNQPFDDAHAMAGPPIHHDLFSS